MTRTINIARNAYVTGVKVYGPIIALRVNVFVAPAKMTTM